MYITNFSISRASFNFHVLNNLLAVDLIANWAHYLLLPDPHGPNAIVFFWSRCQQTRCLSPRPDAWSTPLSGFSLCSLYSSPNCSDMVRYVPTGVTCIFSLWLPQWRPVAFPTTRNSIMNLKCVCPNLTRFPRLMRSRLPFDEINGHGLWFCSLLSPHSLNLLHCSEKRSPRASERPWASTPKVLLELHPTPTAFSH